MILKKIKLLKHRQGHFWPDVLYESLWLVVEYIRQTPNRHAGTSGDLPQSPRENCCQMISSRSVNVLFLSAWCCEMAFSHQKKKKKTKTVRQLSNFIETQVGDVNLHSMIIPCWTNQSTGFYEHDGIGGPLCVAEVDTWESPHVSSTIMIHLSLDKIWDLDTVSIHLSN